MKALFWFLVFLGVTGALSWAMFTVRRMLARKREHETRAMLFVAEAMRARNPGTCAPDSGSPPDQTPT